MKRVSFVVPIKVPPINLVCDGAWQAKTPNEIAALLNNFRGGIKPDGKRDDLLKHFDRPMQSIPKQAQGVTFMKIEDFLKKWIKAAEYLIALLQEKCLCNTASSPLHTE